MIQKIKYFQKILEYKHPTLYHMINVVVNTKSNYTQYMGSDGRMRAEINYNSRPNYDVIISFPNRDGLYYDINFFIKFVWNVDDVLGSYDFDGINHIRFTL